MGARSGTEQFAVGLLKTIMDECSCAGGQSVHTLTHTSSSVVVISESNHIFSEGGMLQ